MLDSHVWIGYSSGVNRCGAMEGMGMVVDGQVLPVCGFSPSLVANLTVQELSHDQQAQKHMYL